MALLPYQIAWVNDRSPLKVYEKSRRIGITWAEAADCVVEAAKKNGCPQWYIGYNESMTDEFIQYCADWAQRVRAATQGVEEVVIKDPDKDILSQRIRFASGHHITALSSRPTNLRGHGGVAIIDEAAYHDDLPALIKAAIAFQMWGGRVHVISTHNGTQSDFSKLVEDIRAGRRPGVVHRTTLDDALRDGLYREIAKAEGKEWSAAAEAEWRAALLAEYKDDADEELFCIASEAAGPYLPGWAINACMQPGIPVIRGKGGEDSSGHRIDVPEQIEYELDQALRTKLNSLHRSCFGVDFGRSADLTVIWILQIESNMRRVTPFIVELRNVEHEQQRDILFHIADRLPRFFSGVLDKTGNGSHLAEVAGLRYGLETKERPGRIEALGLDQNWYINNMPKFKAAFEDQNIIVPRDDNLYADLQLIRMERGIAKVPDKRIRGTDAGMSHGDRAIAAALAYYASDRGHIEYAYQPVGTAPSVRAPAYHEEDDRSSAARDWGVSRNPFGGGKGAW